jgi:hypothetical protein
MQRNGAVLSEPDLRSFDENRRNFPSEKLLAFAGKHVAWSPEGTRILASADSREKVDEKLEANGIHFSQVVHDYIGPLL